MKYSGFAYSCQLIYRLKSLYYSIFFFKKYEGNDVDFKLIIKSTSLPEVFLDKQSRRKALLTRYHGINYSIPGVKIFTSTNPIKNDANLFQEE